MLQPRRYGETVDMFLVRALAMRRSSSAADSCRPWGYGMLAREMAAVAAAAGRGFGISHAVLRRRVCAWLLGMRVPRGYNRSWLCAGLGVPLAMLRMPPDGREFPFQPRTAIDGSPWTCGSVLTAAQETTAD